MALDIKDNIRISIESEKHYWDDLVTGLEIALRNPNLSSAVRSAMTQFKTKLTNSLEIATTGYLSIKEGYITMDVAATIDEVASGAKEVSAVLAEVGPAEAAVEATITTTKEEAVHVGSFLQSLFADVDLSHVEEETVAAVQGFLAKIKAAF